MRTTVHVGAALPQQRYRSIFKSMHSGEENPDSPAVIAQHAATYGDDVPWWWCLKCAPGPISGGVFYAAQKQAIAAIDANGGYVVLQTKGDHSMAEQRGGTQAHLVDLMSACADVGFTPRAVLRTNEPDLFRPDWLPEASITEEAILAWWRNSTARFLTYMAANHPTVERWVAATSNVPRLVLFLQQLSRAERALVDAAVCHNYRSDPQLPGTFGTVAAVRALMENPTLEVVNGETAYSWNNANNPRQDEDVLLAYAVAMNMRHAERDQLCFDFNLSDKPGQVWDGPGYFDQNGDPREAYQAHSRFLSQVSGTMMRTQLYADAAVEYGVPNLHAGAWRSGGRNRVLLVNAPTDSTNTSMAWKNYHINGSTDPDPTLDAALELEKDRVKAYLDTVSGEDVDVALPQAEGSRLRIVDSYGGVSRLANGDVRLEPNAVALLEVNR